MKPTLRILAAGALVLISALQTFGQDRAPQAASQAEVNAGVVANKYISPATAAGVPGNNTNASKYIGLASLTTPDETRDINGFFRSLNDSGAITNYVDGWALAPRFNPTTNLVSLLGRPYTGSLIPDANRWGDWVTVTNPLCITLPYAVSNFTLVYTVENIPANGYSIVSLFNTNTLSAVYQQVGTTLSWVWERNQGTYPYANNYNNYGNLLMPLWGNAYDYSVLSVQSTERHVYALTRSNGVYQVWQDGVPAKTGLSVPVYAYTSPVVTSDVFTNLGIGMDGTNSTGSSGIITNAVISSVHLFSFASSNLVSAAYRATRWLEPESTDDWWFGDSLLAAVASSDNYYSYIYEARTRNHASRNTARGGAYGRDFAGATGWTQLGGPAAVTNVDFQKVRTVNVFYGFGINDIYGGGRSSSTVYTDITNGLAPYNNPNIRLWFFEVPPLSTNGSPANSYAYSLAYETNSWTVNQLCLTNSNFYFYRVIPRWDYLTQFLLNTNNGYTVDGLHFNGANKRVNYHVVNTMFGDAWVDPSTQTIK